MSPAHNKKQSSDPAIRGRRSWAELEAAQQRMAELHSRRILLNSSGTTSGNHHRNSASATCTSASLHIDRLRARLPPHRPPTLALATAFSVSSCPKRVGRAYPGTEAEGRRSALNRALASAFKRLFFVVIMKKWKFDLSSVSFMTKS
jgi:hypothetical protein